MLRAGRADLGAHVRIQNDTGLHLEFQRYMGRLGKSVRTTLVAFRIKPLSSYDTQLPVVSSGRDKDTRESRGFGETGVMKSQSNNLFTVNFRLCLEKQLKLSLRSLPRTLQLSKQGEWERVRIHSRKVQDTGLSSPRVQEGRFPSDTNMPSSNIQYP